MSYACEILADSVSDAGHRLTTFCVTFPRMILAEVNTHRMLSRNSASSRAIPIEKSIAAIEAGMFIPEAFGAHQKGMRADRVLSVEDGSYAAMTWESAGEAAIDHAQSLHQSGVHKAWANRILEPYKWHTAIVTATEWSNFFALRTDSEAQPEFRKIALAMQDAYRASTPILLGPDDWHTPLVEDAEIIRTDMDIPNWKLWKQVSIGRCARVSYLTHDGKRDIEADVELHGRLLPKHHLSPFEHVARPFSKEEWRLVSAVQEWIQYVSKSGLNGPVDPAHAAYLTRMVEFQGNLKGWHSARMDVENEHDYGKVTDAVHS